jgi:hypothetical protein
MSWTKILLINLTVFVGLVLAAEIGLRILWTGYKCIKSECDFARLTEMKVYDNRDGTAEKNIGLSEYSDLLGYQPKAGFSGKIVEWDNKYLSINEKGYRSNGNTDSKIEKGRQNKILVVGDSFAFGSQVGDNETWPSCVELKTKRLTLNAGVFGYGSAQAVRRAQVIQKNEIANTVILSILIGSDFQRDQLQFRDGFPRPAVIIKDRVVSYADVPSIESVGTKWYPKDVTNLVWMTEYSMLGAKLVFALGIDPSGMRRYEKHPDAATLDQIIEFTLTEFSKIGAENKFVLLQYSETEVAEPSSDLLKIKDQTILFAKKKNIKVIDTSDELKRRRNSSKEPIWYGHHTPYGNSLVCNEILQHLRD